MPWSKVHHAQVSKLHDRDTTREIGNVCSLCKSIILGECKALWGELERVSASSLLIRTLNPL